MSVWPLPTRIVPQRGGPVCAGHCPISLHTYWSAFSIKVGYSSSLADQASSYTISMVPTSCESVSRRWKSRTTYCIVVTKSPRRFSTRSAPAIPYSHGGASKLSLTYRVRTHERALNFNSVVSIRSCYRSSAVQTGSRF